MRIKPNPEYPIVDGFFGYDDRGGVKRSSSEVYFPSIYSQISCKVNSMHFELLSMKMGTLEIEFELLGDINISQVYLGEEWKRMATSFFIDSLKGRFECPQNPFPIFALILNKNLRVSCSELL